MTWQNETEELFRKLKPILGAEKLDRLWLAYQTRSDQKSRSEILGVLHILAAKYLDDNYDRKLLLSVPSAELIGGEYPLGKVTHGTQEYHSFGLRENEWIQHVGIFGRSGSGKTNVVFVILWNLLQKKKPFLIFDWKRNYRDYLYHKEGKDIKVYTVGREVNPFFFNPLIPPKGTNPQVWLKKLIEIMCHAYFLGEGVAYLLQKAIDQTYTDFGVYSGNPIKYPTFKDVQKSLESIQVKGRSAQWMDSTIRTLGVLCFGEFSRVLNTENNFPVEELLKENAILELDCLTNSDKTFFIEALLLWIHHYRMSERDRETFKHAIIIEEAHHILLRKKQEMTGEEAVTDIILREIRELGESIVLIDQHPSMISMPALGNTYTTICMNLKHKADMRTISESLLLDNEQIDYLGQLEVGKAIVKLQGRYFRPFLVKIPLFPIKKGEITDEDIKSKKESDSLESGVIRAGEELNRVIRDIRGLVKGEREEDRERQEKEQGEGLIGNEREFLIDIGRFPVSGVTTRYSRMGLSRHQGNELQKSLILKGFITFRQVSSLKGRLKVLVLTDKGKDAIKDVKIEKVFNKNASWEHEYWKYRIGMHYRKRGYDATFEYRIGEGKSVDVVAEKNGKKIAIEIETGKSDYIYNIKKNLEYGFDDIIVAALDKGIKDKILPELKESGLSSDEKIKVTEIADILNTD
jgi:DNA-binding MarR family transcriptional regulator